ncbi:MAG: GlsB/YeaQ/YmgE family stress response membrane protein [Thermomicrobiales bacterium]|nr:GlsB/YeaQ/YmgE family stress response membrane protein [Thermomicrobiales bacterium]
MGIVIWIVFGAVVGWLGSRLAGEPQSGCLTNIVIGIAGSMLGGAIVTIATGNDLLFGTGGADFLLNFAASVVGAAILILALRALGRRS